MSDPQIISTPAGERMAILPLEEYRHLLRSTEELSDIRAYDRAIEQLAKGQDEMIPSEFADRILEGESAVRVWREYRKMSVKELAGQANISASYLSQIEGGSRSGSLPTMKALAKALRLKLADLT